MTRTEIAEDDSLELTDDTVIEEISDWDSLNNVDLEMALETSCKIDFEVGEFEELKTVGAMIDTVANKVD